MKMRKIRSVIYFIILIFLFSSINAQISREKFDKTVDYCISKLKQEITEIPEGKYPLRTKGLGEWELTEPWYWTSGFYPGTLWEGYLLKPEEILKENAVKFTEGLEDQKFNNHTHDIGFMIFDSFGNGYKITGKPEYKDIVLQAAKTLSTRFNEKVGCIQSWDGNYQVIIDNMMNLELLFWASKNSGEKKLYDMAVSHANKTIENHIRENGTTFHVVEYDSLTGEILRKRTHQGYADSSCWARGQAWGIYGFTMCFRETGDSLYLKTAEKLAGYFIKHLPQDFVPYWDFNLPDTSSKKFRDASAGAIALSGLLELRNYVKDASFYDETINNILNSLIDNYLSVGTDCSGIILHCAYNVNTNDPYNWDAATSWGDYYFLESLLRYQKDFLKN